jgi:hypothetical protein
MIITIVPKCAVGQVRGKAIEGKFHLRRVGCSQLESEGIIRHRYNKTIEPTARTGLSCPLGGSNRV